LALDGRLLAPVVVNEHGQAQECVLPPAAKADVRRGRGWTDKIP
jgi:hypothetical protein